jgi:hypothetical protein
MNSELEVLLDVVARLEGAGIPYMLTGSIAMSLYAEPRMTRDIDLVVELAGAEAAHVAGLFAPDYYVEEEAVRAAIASRGLVNLFHLEHLVKVDLIVRKDDEFRRHDVCAPQPPVGWIAVGLGGREGGPDSRQARLGGRGRVGTAAARRPQPPRLGRGPGLPQALEPADRSGGAARALHG